jgi:hypothetical protein
MEYEPGAIPALAGFDPPDEQHVIAGAVHRVVAALEPCDAALDQRRVGGAEAERHAVEAVGVLAPSAPTDVDATVDNESMNLDIDVTWTASPGATSYNIFRGSTPNDRDEVYGTLGGLNLPALGASPVHKNIFVEADWYDTSRPSRLPNVANQFGNFQRT